MAQNNQVMSVTDSPGKASVGGRGNKTGNSQLGFFSENKLGFFSENKFIYFQNKIFYFFLIFK